MPEPMADFTLPEMIPVRRRFPRPLVEDIEGDLRGQLAVSGSTIRPGAQIAIAVGSRGIANLQRIVAETVRWIKAHGAQPFIVPAMGSHGGATAPGQRAVLESYGITEALIGAPIRASMEVVELPNGDLPTKVYFDKQAAAAEATIVINRIKPHTDFQGPHESGLLKMIAIGLGKQQQALALHRYGIYGLRELMPKVAAQSLRHNNVILGIGIVENAYDETSLLRVIPKEQLAEEEQALLNVARARMPSLPLAELDILIVDEMGKDISGTGLDTNIIGRRYIPDEPEPAEPRIKMIVVRDLTKASHGNACGMGLADIITRRLFAKLDLPVTNANVFTSGFLARGKLPLVAETDHQALEFAWRGAGLLEPDKATIIRIQNTLRLSELAVSPAVLAALTGQADIEVVGLPSPLFQ